MTPIEEAVPVSDPVAEAVGRLTEAKPNVITRDQFGASVEHLTVVERADLDTLLAAWRKAGEQIAELDAEVVRCLDAMNDDGQRIADLRARAEAAEARVAELEEWQRLHEPMLADGDAVTRALARALEAENRSEAAEARLAEAKRLLKGRDDFLVERDLFSEFAAWIAGQPVPDPTLEVTK